MPLDPHDQNGYQPQEPLASASLDHRDDYHIPGHEHTEMYLASVEEKKKLWWKSAFVNCLFIASWFSFATVLSLYNKWMFSPDRFGFPFPLFVSTFHMFVQFGMAAFIRAVWPRRFRPARNPTRAEYGKKAVPAAVATSLDVGLSNLSLKSITLSFYTMCKSSSLIFVLLFAFLFRLEKFSLRLIGVIFLIFSGVLLMVATETSFVLQGFILVISASALGGFRWALTQIIMKNKKMGMDNPAATVYWLSPMMGITLAIVSAVVEDWPAVFRSHFFGSVGETVWSIFFLTAPGAVAFCMVMSEFYIIQRVGMVPMSIAGIAKEVTTITLSAWVFGDELTPLNITGVGITVCGIGLFTFHKYRKSIESTVPLDAHGNPITSESLNEFDDGYSTHLRETDAPASLHSEDSDLESPRMLFSEDEGEGDAEELRSIRSSKIRQYSVRSGTKPNGSGRVDESAPLVAPDAGD